MKHVLKAQQFNRKLIAQVFDFAEEMERVVAAGGSEEFRGKIMGSLFYAVSTRTRLSFEAAMHRLGGSVISTEHPDLFSDFVSSSHFEDTISVVNQYADVIVLRHTDPGMAKRAAAVSSIPVINAGGGDQHPTQALLDLYTIYRAVDGLDGVTVVLMGDLANTGTGRSLCYFLAKYSGVKLCLVSPKELAMRDDIVDYLGRNGVGFKLIHSPGAELEEALRTADVVNQIDLPLKFTPSEGPPRKGLRVDRKMLDLMGPRAIIMHPLHRVVTLPRTSTKIPALTLPTNIQRPLHPDAPAPDAVGALDSGGITDRARSTARFRNAV
jgi:aspartate carbamoyltransferase catalytic subunit